MIEGLNEAFANYFGLSSLEAFKLSKIHIKELIPDICENVNYILKQRKEDCLSFKGILHMPESFNYGDQSTYGFGAHEESSEDIGGNFDSSTKIKNAVRTINNNNNKNSNRLFKRVKKYAINYDITVDSFHPYGMKDPLNIFIVNIVDVNDMTKSGTSFFFSQKNGTSSEYNPEFAKTKIIITRAPDIKYESKKKIIYSLC